MTNVNNQEVMNEKQRAFLKKVEELEQELVDYAMEHDLYLSLGDYGSGRTLLTPSVFKQKQSEYGYDESDEEYETLGWNDRRVGDWLYSSEEC
jgi:hypothetical protein